APAAIIPINKTTHAISPKRNWLFTAGSSLTSRLRRACFPLNPAPQAGEVLPDSACEPNRSYHRQHVPISTREKFARQLFAPSIRDIFALFVNGSVHAMNMVTQLVIENITE